MVVSKGLFSIGAFLAVLGIILLIIVILLHFFVNNTQVWWIWLIFGLGAGFGVLGIILMCIYLGSKYQEKRKKLEKNDEVEMTVIGS